jgi:hypothetical protein
MKTDPEDIHELVEALRSDLPTERDAARIRARLAGFGVALGAGITSSEAVASLAGAKAAASAGSAGLWSQFAALSWGAKVGIAAAVSVSAVTGPLIVSNMESERVRVPAAGTSPDSTALATSAPKNLARPSEQEPSSVPSATEASASNTDVVASPAPPAAEVRTEPQASAPAAKELQPRSVAQVFKAPSQAGVAETAAPPSVAAAAVAEPAAPSGTAAIPADQAIAPAITEPAIAAPASVTALGEETRLIDAAFSALRAGDRESAKHFVREHERRFPNGMLRRERERARTALLGRQ